MQPILVARPSVVPGKEHQIRTTYNDKQQPLTVTESGWAPGMDGKPATPLTRTTRYTYGTVNGRSLLNQIDGPLPNGKNGTPDDSDITTIRYDAQGNHAAEIIAPGKRITRITHVDEAGRPVMLETGDGVNPTQRVKTAWNAFNQPTMVAVIQHQNRTRWQRWGDAILDWLEPRRKSKPLTALITKIDYDANQRPTRITKPDGTWTQAEYDAAGRPTVTRDQEGNTMTRERDGENNLLATILHSPDRQAPLDAKTHYRYDDANRMTDMIAATGAMTKYAYDQHTGQLADSTDPIGRKTAYAYDDRSEMTAIIQNAGTPNAATTKITDKDGRQTVTAANGAITITLRDDFGNARQIDSPDSGSQVADYDVAGRITRSIDANGNATTYAYNAAGQVTQRLTTGKQGTAESTYEYEGSKLVAVANTHQATSYAYDANGRLSEKVERLTKVGSQKSFFKRTFDFATHYRYDAFGRLIARTLPSGETVITAYDPSGRVAKMELTSADGKTVRPVVTGIQSNAFLGTTAFTHGNGLKTAYQHNQQTGQLTALATTSPATGLPLYAQTLTHDMADRIIAMARNGGGTAGSQQEQYRYDSFDRLSHVDTPIEKSTWTYDKVGNRLSADIALPAPKKETLSYAPASNRLLAIATADGQVKYDYDKAGNPVKIGERKFIYGLQNRMQQVREGSRVIADYAYNAYGERVSKTVSDANGKATTTYFLYHDSRLESDIDEAGSIISHNLYLNDRPIAKLEVSSRPEIQESRIYAVHSDHLGTPRKLSDYQKLIVWEAGYTSFGEALPTIEKLPQNLRFPGQFHDHETTTHYNYFRDYFPETGRYFQSDPIGMAGGLNSYSYAVGNPVSMFDPFGLLVTGIYSISTGILTIEDATTGAVASSNAFTGGEFVTKKPTRSFQSNPEKKIPLGDYMILDHRNQSWFRLDPIDDVPYNDVLDDETGRSAFRLHPGSNSLGCITVDKYNKKNMSRYERIVEMIRSTQSTTVSDMHRKSLIQGPYPIPYGDPVNEPINMFGTIKVVR